MTLEQAVERVRDLWQTRAPWVLARAGGGPRTADGVRDLAAALLDGLRPPLPPDLDALRRFWAGGGWCGQREVLAGAFPEPAADAA